MEKFKKAFRRLPDPRADNARHELLEVLFIALAATLCGAEGPSDMATFGQSKEGLLRLVLQLQHEVPSHDTFSRVFRLLDPQAFEAAFRRFMAGFAKANGLELRGVVAVDGKALRGAFERGRQSTPLHMVNVWAAEARMCLAQRKAPGRNEAAGALEVLGLLDLEGCIVTADALHCHRDFASTVLERGADYVLALKENQSKLFAAAARRYARSGARSVAERREPATHDRCEWRRATVLRDTTFAAVQKFPGVVALARITSRRRVLGACARAFPRCATSCSPNIFPPSNCCASCAPIGGSRTSCIGYSMSSSTRIATELAKTTRPRTLLSSESSPSIWSAVTPRPRPCARKSNARGGTTPSSWACSVICDSPAHKGEGSTPSLLLD